jgi:hypothetical protein
MLPTMNAFAGITTYTDQASFSSVTTGLSTQTFGFLSACNVSPGTGVFVNNSLNSTTSNGYVMPGDILPGLDISANTNVGNDLALIAPGFAGTGIANYSVFGNYPGSGLVITLSPGVTAFSMGVLGEFSISDASISLYDPGSTLLGTFTLASAPTSSVGAFWGATTGNGTTIGSVVLTNADAPFSGIDQVQFGSSTPEPGTLLLLGSGLLGAVGMVRRKLS